MAKKHNTNSILKFFQDNKANIIGWTAIILVIAVGAWLITFSSQQAEEQRKQSLAISETDHVKGASNAKVTLVEYADFQCPACRSYSGITAQLRQEFSEDELRIVYRHFPLNIHPNAVPAAKAAEAAAEQDKFWQMHDLLYVAQNEWAEVEEPLNNFKNYAKQLQLDLEKFETDYQSEKIANRVDEDLESARDLGLNSTPSFFINGEPFSAPRSIDGFQQAIEAKLNN